MRIYLLILFYKIRNFFGTDFTKIGTTQVVCRETDDWRIEGYYEAASLTPGKTYVVERQDRISYYLKNDKGFLSEVSKSNFEDINSIRSQKLKKLGI